MMLAMIEVPESIAQKLQEARRNKGRPLPNGFIIFFQEIIQKDAVLIRKASSSLMQNPPHLSILLLCLHTSTIGLSVVSYISAAMVVRQISSLFATMITSSMMNVNRVSRIIASTIASRRMQIAGRRC